MIPVNMRTTNGFNYVDFDPRNKKHRAAFVVFRATGKWPDTTRFILDPLYHSVPTMINQKLLDFYFTRDRAIPEDVKNIGNIQQKTYQVGLDATTEE